MLTTSEIEAEYAKLVWPKKATLEQRQAYNDAASALLVPWAEWLWQVYAPEATSEQSIFLFERAWSDDHSNGYRQVEHCYEDLANFVHRYLELG